MAIDNMNKDFSLDEKNIEQEETENIQVAETNCQRFTPVNIADLMVDFIDFDEKLINKKILENSFGTGVVLKSIIKKIIIYFLHSGVSKRKIKSFLEKNIVGFEIDQRHIDTCKNELDNITNEYDIKNVNWNLIKRDYLKDIEYKKFDYIIGNPPYISYRNMSKHFTENYMTFIKENFSSCEQGAFDYSFPFVQKSYESLNPNGKLIYVLPNSIYKNKAAKKIRNCIKNDVVEIIDFAPYKVFNDALVAVSILVLRKDSNIESFRYYKYNVPKDTKEFKNNIIKASILDRFIFNVEATNEGNTKFGELFNASMTIATLLNTVFLINEEESKKLEPELIKKAVSPRNIDKINEYIIYPYLHEENQIIRLNEETLKINYPNVYDHLLLKKDKLKERAIENTTSWFEYGRSQGLNIIHKEKLLISAMITKQIRISKLEADCVAYSGIWIVTKSDYDLDVATKILSDERFLKYVEKVGANASGNTIRIKTTDINNYRFDIENYI